MCGIAGTVNWGDDEALARMTQVQSHRGPDDSGVWSRHFPDGGYMGLGSRRLAIIDLSPAGHMPMGTPDGGLWITYNGEVYNFPELRRELAAKGCQFRSHSDTEVVLELYSREGPECVKRLNGMFAMAVCDLRGPRPSLFLARDHFGVKPLYYIHRGRQLGFASEVKALLELPGVQAEMDLEGLHQYLTLLWIPDPSTMFRDVFKLPAGHYALFREGRLEITQYWDLAFPPAGTGYKLSAEELKEEVRARLRQSVKAQMISDVPLGAFLSAGMDSSSIVAMMAQASEQPVRTYTITFPPKYRVGEKTLDDPGVARRVAQQFGCEHHEIVVEPDVTSLLPKLVWHMDEPTADPAIITAYLVSREARKTVTVLLSGVGGDELFAGYRRHYAHHFAQAYRKLPRWARRHFIEPAVQGFPGLRGTPFKGLVRLAKKMVRSGSLSPTEAFLMNCTYFDDAGKAELYSPALRAQVNGFGALGKHRAYFQQVTHADFLNQLLYLDSKTFMVTLNLTYNDKMSMASSVEARVPFLDRELAEFVAWKVPPRMKLKGFLRPTTKYILREAMRGILPAEVLGQPKAGFGAPVDYWLAHDLGAMLDDLLSERQVRGRGLFEPATVQRLVSEHRSGRQDWSMELWQLLTLELWQQIFVDRSSRDFAAEGLAARPLAASA